MFYLNFNKQSPFDIARIKGHNHILSLFNNESDLSLQKLEKKKLKVNSKIGIFFHDQNDIPCYIRIRSCSLISEAISLYKKTKYYRSNSEFFFKGNFLNPTLKLEEMNIFNGSIVRVSHKSKRILL